MIFLFTPPGRPLLSCLNLDRYIHIYLKTDFVYICFEQNGLLTILLDVCHDRWRSVLSCAQLQLLILIWAGTIWVAKSVQRRLCKCLTTLLMMEKMKTNWCSVTIATNANVTTLSFSQGCTSMNSFRILFLFPYIYSCIFSYVGTSCIWLCLTILEIQNFSYLTTLHYSCFINLALSLLDLLVMRFLISSLIHFLFTCINCQIFTVNVFPLNIL